MKTRALALLTLAVAVTGCRENLGSVAPFGVCAPPNDASTCAMDASCAAYLAGRPWFYVTSGGVVNELELFMQWNNQLPDNSDPTSGRTNTNTFYIEQYDLSFSGPVAIPSISVPALAPPVPAEGTATSVVPVIPSQISQYLQTALPASGSPVVITVSVKASGRLGDDSTFETGSFVVPVDVFNTGFAGYVCATGTVTAVCPNGGQTASFKCE